MDEPLSISADASPGKDRRAGLKRFLFYAALSLVAMTMILPFTWMVLTSFKTQPEVVSQDWIPAAWRTGKGPGGGAAPRVLENYDQVFREIKFGRYYFNSVLVAGWVTFLQVLTSSMAAYAFARIPWRGRDKVFLLYLATMMIPGVVLIIPNYQTMFTLNQVWSGWLDGYKALIIPASFSAFGTFLLRQFMLTIPLSLDEAAEIDGASRFRIFWDVILPLARPGVITLSIFTFMGNYGSFFWPLITIRSDEMLTLPIGMLYFDSYYQRATHLLMAASVMNVAPLIVLFVLLQKYLVKGIQLGAVKG